MRATSASVRKFKYDDEIDHILERGDSIEQIVSILKQNDALPPSVPRTCIFVYGKAGVGKTEMVRHILQRMEYDVVHYDSGDVRNKSVFEHLGKTTAPTNNVYHLFHQKIKRIVVVMDEIEGMNNGDRGGINSLIKLIRPKATSSSTSSSTSTSSTKTRAKAKVREDTDGSFMCSIICICNHNIDKKISEIMKLCHTIYLAPPTPEQMERIAKRYVLRWSERCRSIIRCCNGDVRKLFLNVDLLNKLEVPPKEATVPRGKQRAIDVAEAAIYENMFNVNVKSIVYNLLRGSIHSENHQFAINDSNRTMISLIWHENIVDYLDWSDAKHSLDTYHEFMKNMCTGDYVDRITFQKQIWQLNEMTSYIKVLYNHHILLERRAFDQTKLSALSPTDVRFTKVLTKYSSEYNNYLFLQLMCHKLGVDRKDVLSLIACCAYKHRANMAAVLDELSAYKISLLEVKRIYKFIQKIEYANSHAAKRHVGAKCDTHGGAFDAEDMKDVAYDADVEMEVEVEMEADE